MFAKTASIMQKSTDLLKKPFMIF